MKTNTTKIRRALTAFAMTGAMLPLTNLFAAEIVVGPEQTYTTVGAVGKVQLDGNTAILSGDTVESSTISYEYFDTHSPIVTLKSDSDTIRTIDLNGSGRLLYHNTYDSATTLNGENIKIINGVHETEGGAIAATGALTVNGNIIFEGNRTNSGTTGGGAVYGNQGDLTIDGTHTFNNNYSDYYGGAAFLDYNSTYTMTINGENTFTNNTAGWSGGAVSTDSGNMVISGKNIFKNNSAKYAGAVAVRNATNSSLIISGENTFEGNSATQGEGGAIKAEAVGKITITGTNNFLNNTAVTGGGAIYAPQTSTDMLMEISGNNTFSGNSVTAEGKLGGAITTRYLVFSGEGSKATFTNNTAGGKENDIYIGVYPHGVRDGSLTIKDGGEYYFGGGIVQSGTTPVSIMGTENGAPTVTFGGSSTSSFDSLSLSNGANVTFQSGAKLTVNNGATVNNATLNLEGGVDFDGTISMENTTANFTAAPGDHGFSTLKADSFSGTVNVGLNAFTVGAMDGDTVTLIDGAKAENINITNSDLMTDANVDGKTAVKITTDKDGQFGSAPLADSKLVGIDFGKGNDSMVVENFSLIVDGKDIDLNAFAKWLGEETGLETAVGTGYVSVDLEMPIEIMASDSFIWDFSGFNGDVSLQFVTANIMDNTVPEPTTWALLVLGGLGVFGVARKNRKAKK